MRRVSALTAICTLLACGVARSTTVIPPSFDTLVSSASTIFVGEVIGQRAMWEATRDGRAIVTIVTFRVHDVWKGTVAPVTELEFLGGTLDGVTMQVHGMPAFRVGQRDVLFVNGIARAISPLVGYMHGRMRIERDTSANVDRVRTHDGRALGSIAEIGPQRRNPMLSVTPMRLIDFAAAVKARVSGGRVR